MFALGAGSAALVVLLRVYYGLRMRGLQRELALLRVKSGEFTEEDIATVLSHAVSLEVRRDDERAQALLRVVAEKSADPGTVKLAKARLDRLANP